MRSRSGQARPESGHRVDRSQTSMAARPAWFPPKSRSRTRSSRRWPCLFRVGKMPRPLRRAYRFKQTPGSARRRAGSGSGGPSDPEIRPGGRSPGAGRSSPASPSASAGAPPDVPPRRFVAPITWPTRSPPPLTSADWAASQWSRPIRPPACVSRGVRPNSPAATISTLRSGHAVRTDAPDPAGHHAEVGVVGEGRGSRVGPVSTSIEPLLCADISWCSDRTRAILSASLAWSGNSSQRSMPGTKVGIGRNGPQLSAGASGLGS